MDGKGLMTGFYRISEWIMRLAYVNILWGVFILFGGIVFGVGPSTVAMFAVTRKWVMGETDIPIFRTFLKSYKTEFKKANILMLLLLVIGYVLYIDLKFFQGKDGVPFLLISYLMFGLMVMLLVITMYILPIFVHYELKLFQYFRNAALFTIMHPILTIAMALACIAVFFILYSIPGLIPFFGGSFISAVLMWFSYRVFINIEVAKSNMDQGIEE
jgi:uncharacterized membrane protein YesL